eukprot:Phypoly_transcript_06169.p1 GENE.Phypoly_transcript_06169~~Phypoly_transcript_06169.p1  ORF type:complete len:577 (+),score=106.79 Phypoly_transcript_06169:35-1765(+)
MVSILPRKNNLLAAIAVSEVVRTSLGPHARNKLLVDDTGHVTSSNDGHTVLQGLPVEHPIGELIVQLSSGQDDAIGDGTTSVVVVFGALCSKALYLINKGVHPSVIIDGYQKACEYALSELSKISLLQHALPHQEVKAEPSGKEISHEDQVQPEVSVSPNLAIQNKSTEETVPPEKEISKPGQPPNLDGQIESAIKTEMTEKDTPSDQLLQFLANTALHSKVAEQDRLMLSNMCVRAIKLVKNHEKLGSAHNINLQRIDGGSLEQTRLLSGIILPNKSFAHPSMPRLVQNGERRNIAVLSFSLDPPRPKTQFSVHAVTREDHAVMRNLAQLYAQDTLATFLRLGVKVVFCQWGVDPYLAEILAANGIVVIKWIAGNDLERVAITVGALICPYLPTLSASMLGSSPRIAEIGDEPKYIEIEGTGATIIVRGSETVAESAMISIHDALFVLENSYSDPSTVAGGGATEIELYTRVCDFAKQESTKDQYIITGWAEALLSIPTTLAENASCFAPDIVSQLIALHRKGMSTLGVGARDEIQDMAKGGIWELLKMKYSVISLATESVCHVIKIDDCILLPK